MSVYVDDMEAQFGRLVMCHMIADSTEELLAMADAIGVQRRWIQHPGTYREHFDIAKSKRAAAVKLGAVEITQRELATKLMARHNPIGQIRCLQCHQPYAEFPAGCDCTICGGPVSMCAGVIHVQPP